MKAENRDGVTDRERVSEKVRKRGRRMEEGEWRKGRGGRGNGKEEREGQKERGNEEGNRRKGE